MIDTIAEGFKQSLLMAYEVWWALVLGFAISAMVEAWIPRQQIEGALAGSGLAPLAKATGLGAASSSCSYAAIAIARSLFARALEISPLAVESRPPAPAHPRCSRGMRRYFYASSVRRHRRRLMM